MKAEAEVTVPMYMKKTKNNFKVFMEGNTNEFYKK